jgi:hypothetical protein
MKQFGACHIVIEKNEGVFRVAKTTQSEIKMTAEKSYFDDSNQTIFSYLVR